VEGSRNAAQLQLQRPQVQQENLLVQVSPEKTMKLKRYVHHPVGGRLFTPRAPRLPIKREFSVKCQTCKKVFPSARPDKKFHNTDCYIKSPQFAAMIKELGKRRTANRQTKNCLECGVEFPRKQSDWDAGMRFHNKLCRRAYQAKRFDRWIASPETIALPQNYDEFLTDNILSCLVEGCRWAGHNLSIHMNRTHGLDALNFKVQAGFNLRTGVISAPMSEKMSNSKIEADKRRKANGVPAWQAEASHSHERSGIAWNVSKKTEALLSEESKRIIVASPVSSTKGNSHVDYLSLEDIEDNKKRGALYKNNRKMAARQERQNARGGLQGRRNEA
jgi:hypothetical protein